MLNQSKLINASKNNQTTRGDLIKTQYMFVKDLVSFFTSPSVPQQQVAFSIDSVTQLLQTYGLAGNLSNWKNKYGPIFPSDTTSPSNVGMSVSISSDGNTFAVGGPLDNSGIGATWIFIRSDNIWIQQGLKLVANDYIGPTVGQGQSVALSSDGNTLAVGGDFDDSLVGATWIFVRSGLVWTQQGSKLVASDATVFTSLQGHSVSLSSDGNTLAVGGPAHIGNIGATWIYTRSGVSWTQQTLGLVASDYIGNPNQGNSVSLSSDGNTLAVGGPSDNTNIGATWVYIRSGIIWTQQGLKLVANDYVGNPSVAQGISVSISSDGNTLAVGGPANNSGIGAAWIYIRDEFGAWTQQGPSLTGNNTFGAQGFSVSLSGSGDILIVGPNTGYVYTFVRTDNIWSQQSTGLFPDNTYGQFGHSVSISTDGLVLVVGSFYNTDGSAWIFY